MQKEGSFCYNFSESVSLSKHSNEEKSHLCEIVKCRNYGCDMKLHQCKLVEHQESCRYRNVGLPPMEPNFSFNFLQTINPDKIEETKKALTKISAGVSSTLDKLTNSFIGVNGLVVNETLFNVSQREPCFFKSALNEEEIRRDSPETTCGNEEIFSPLVVERKTRKPKKTKVEIISKKETVENIDKVNTTSENNAVITNIDHEIVQTTPDLIDISENLTPKDIESFKLEEKCDPFEGILNAYKQAKSSSKLHAEETEDLSEIQKVIAAATLHLDNSVNVSNQELSQSFENSNLLTEKLMSMTETELQDSDSSSLSPSFQNCKLNNEEQANDFYSILYNASHSIKDFEWEIISHSNASMEMSHIFAFNYNNKNGTGLIWFMVKKKHKHLLTVYPGLAFMPQPLSKIPIKTLSVVGDDLYLLLENGIIYRREGLDAVTPIGKKWTKFETKEIKNKPIWISLNVSENIIWICDDKGFVWIYEINEKCYLKVDDRRELVMKRITVDPKNCCHVWALNDQNNVYVRQGIVEQFTTGTEWKFVMMISKLNVRSLICANSTLWILTQDRSIYSYSLDKANIVNYVQIKCPIFLNDDISDLSGND